MVRMRTTISRRGGLRRDALRLASVASILLPAAGCRSDEPDAYGNFEATEIVVSAEVGGQLVRFDAVEGNRIAAGRVVGLLDTTQVALQIAELRAQRSAGRAQTGHATAPGAAPIDLRARGWYNPALDYTHYMVPGILVVLVTLIGTLLTAQNIAREKELGTLEQLNVTPVTRTQFIAGKLIPFWTLGMVELAAGLALARFVFGIPMRGSLLLVFAVAAVYLVAALGLGLLISTVAETQQQAMFVTFFVMMVYLLMSGLFTPITSMPDWVRWLAELNPVKHFVQVMRAVLVKGAGLTEIQAPVAALGVFATGVLLLAVHRYSKRSA